MEAPGGWKTALPRPPRRRKRIRIQKEDGTPRRDRKTAERRGPRATKTRRPYRSERYPMSGCSREAARERVMARVAARVMDNPIFSMILGRRGDRKEA
jgi:hypothetical protein